MSQENVEVVKAVWPADVDLVELSESPVLPPQVLAALDPDLKVAFRSEAPGAANPIYHGIAGFIEGWRDWVEPYESYRLTVEDFIDAGDDGVLCPARVKARTRRDGVLIEHAPAAVCAVTDAKVMQVTLYLERHCAFEAVGLRE